MSRGRCGVGHWALSAALVLLALGSGIRAEEGAAAQPPPQAAGGAAEPVDGGILGKRPQPQERRSLGSAPVSAAQATQVLLILGGMIALLAGAAWAFRRAGSGPGSSPSSRLVEVLARTPVGPKQQVVLLRVGSRVLLLGVTADSIQSLTEIRDEAEVEKLTFHTEAPTRASARFKNLLHGMMGPLRPSPPGQFGPEEEEVEARVRREIDALKQKLAGWEEEGQEIRLRENPVEGGSSAGPRGLSL